MVITKTIPIKGDYGPKIEYRGEYTKFSLSPYDVPQYARVSYDKEKHILSIEFKYLTPDEPRHFVAPTDKISFEIGKSSGKIYKIKLEKIESGSKISKITIEMIEKEVDEFIEKIPSKDERNEVQILNFGLAKDILKYEKDLFF